MTGKLRTCSWPVLEEVSLDAELCVPRFHVVYLFTLVWWIIGMC